MINGCVTLAHAGGTLLATPLLVGQAEAEIETNKSTISVRGLSAFQRAAQRNYLAVCTSRSHSLQVHVACQAVCTGQVWHAIVPNILANVFRLHSKEQRIS